MDDKMQIAKGRLGLYAGFWLALASKMQWRAGNPDGGVAHVDGREVVYNRDNLNQRSMGEVVFIALHEIGHPMLCHLTRQGDRDSNVYGIAIDVVLNKFVKKVGEETPILGMEVPDDAIFGHHFDLTDDQVTSVEPVYELLLKKCKGKPKRKFDNHGKPGNDDGTPLTDAQTQAMEKEWKIAVQAAADMAKKQGKLPGYMQEFIGELLKPKVDWRSQLWAATKIAKDESSYKRFNRRFIADEIYLPGRYSERIGKVGYTIDTSGSISTNEFKQALGEMNYLIEEMKPEVIYFGQCDTRLVSMQELTVDSLPLTANVKGRGGTDMREAFEWACENEDDLDMFILQTDGCVPPLDPSLHPKCPVIIITTTGAKLPAGWDFPTVIRVEV